MNEEQRWTVKDRDRAFSTHTYWRSLPGQIYSTDEGAPLRGEIVIKNRGSKKGTEPSNFTWKELQNYQRLKSSFEKHYTKIFPDP